MRNNEGGNQSGALSDIIAEEPFSLARHNGEGARHRRRWRSETLLVARNFSDGEENRSRIIPDYEAGDDVFVRTMGNLLGPPLLKGNKVTALENGEQIFPAMLDAIRSARQTITFENFLFKEGEVSDAFAEALAERARAGGKVHFLQDALGCNCVHGRALDLVRRAGVQLEIFRFFNMAINFRTHRKLLVTMPEQVTSRNRDRDDWKGNGRNQASACSHYSLKSCGRAMQRLRD